LSGAESSGTRSGRHGNPYPHLVSALCAGQNLAERRVIVKPLSNGERFIVLFTDRACAEAWRARECPQADLWTISTRENLRKFLKGTLSDRTCRITFDPSESRGEKPPMLSIQGLLDRLQRRNRR
jgi:hypothetical protein